MLPKQKDIEIPLLEVLMEIGGKGEPKDIYPLVTTKFPQITEEDLLETLPSGPNKWTNRIQWVRQSLIEKGEVYSPSRGIWAITDQGKKRVEQKVPSIQVINFVELYEEYETSLRSQLLEKLSELTSRQFELFSRKLLQAYGFVNVDVTNINSDGGIDGHGKLRLGLASINVAFQCKRWQGNIGRPEIDKFRGVTQGEFEQGIFFATSDFTAQARSVSLKKGAVPIILLNGESIVNLMIEKGIGVERMPLYLYYQRQFDFIEE